MLRFLIALVALACFAVVSECHAQVRPSVEAAGIVGHSALTAPVRRESPPVEQDFYPPPAVETQRWQLADGRVVGGPKADSPAYRDWYYAVVAPVLQRQRERQDCPGGNCYAPQSRRGWFRR